MIKTQDLLTNGPCKLHAHQNYEYTSEATCSAPSVFVHEHIANQHKSTMSQQCIYQKKKSHRNVKTPPGISMFQNSSSQKSYYKKILTEENMVHKQTLSSCQVSKVTYISLRSLVKFQADWSPMFLLSSITFSVHFLNSIFTL